jgi:hypothetical protein
VLASIRSKTGGAAVVCCRIRKDAVALLIVSKPGKISKTDRRRLNIQG